MDESAGPCPARRPRCRLLVSRMMQHVQRTTPSHVKHTHQFTLRDCVCCRARTPNLWPLSLGLSFSVSLSLGLSLSNPLLALGRLAWSIGESMCGFGCVGGCVCVMCVKHVCVCVCVWAIKVVLPAVEVAKPITGVHLLAHSLIRT